MNAAKVSTLLSPRSNPSSQRSDPRLVAFMSQKVQELSGSGGISHVGVLNVPKPTFFPNQNSIKQPTLFMILKDHGRHCSAVTETLRVEVGLLDHGHEAMAPVVHAFVAFVGSSKSWLPTFWAVAASISGSAMWQDYWLAVWGGDNSDCGLSLPFRVR